MIPRIDCGKVMEYITGRLRWYVLDYACRGSGVIGLSGGVDSSVVTYLATKALGVERVHIYLLPTSVTSQIDTEDAMKVIESLKIPDGNWEAINIDGLSEAFEGLLGKFENLEKGNIMARTRMIILHSKAAIHKGLVLGTGDKSEMLIGYFTKFGDAGVDIMPIAGLYKTHVRQMAKYLGVPERIIWKPPSPNLWPGQTAEGELGIDYETLDTILYMRFDKWLSEEQISSTTGVPREVIDRVLTRVKLTQHKRHLPEVFKVGYRDIGSDWRYPREWR
jgi:NAD+ synthase